jgi:hypothetical protein
VTVAEKERKQLDQHGDENLQVPAPRAALVPRPHVGLVIVSGLPRVCTYTLRLRARGNTASLKPNASALAKCTTGPFVHKPVYILSA